MESTKNSDVRINNRKRVVNSLFRGGAVTKQELSSKLEISLATLTLLLNELTEKGLVTKGEVLGSTGGRKPVRMAPVYDAKFAIGVEISAHELRIVMVNLGANIVASEVYPQGIKNESQYWEKVNTILMDFIERNIKDKNKLLDVGIALQVQMKDGCIVEKNNLLPQYRIDLDEAAKSFNIPVTFVNSAKIAAIAQIWSLNDWEDFAFVSLGTSVGGAIVYQSNIVGFNGCGGDFGSVIVQSKGEGSVKKLSDYCTTHAFCEKAEANGMEEFYEMVENGNTKAVQIWNESLDVLINFLYNLYSILGWKIVIGGALSPYIEKNLELIENRLIKMSEYEDGRIPEIRVSDLGAFGAAVGAALRSIDEFLEFGYNNL
jgi:predicted NBD/HSP70 family sugar kinase